MFSHAEVFKRIQGGFYRKSTLSKTKGSNRSWQYNNGRRDETLAKPSIRERLEDAKRECAEHKPPEKGRPGRDTPEHGNL